MTLLSKPDIDWAVIRSSVDQNGYAVVKGLLNETTCDQLKLSYAQEDRYRKTIVMERYRFGKGEYRYFRYPLPEVIVSLRRLVYEQIVSVANVWMERLGIDLEYPRIHDDFLDLCHAKGQLNATVLILKYGIGGHNTLHQDLYGEVYFPLQVVFCLNSKDIDYTGGEFVLTQQVPRAQSKAIVLTPDKGDAVIFTTNFRPIAGTRGFYRAVMKHGVSEVKSGQRFTLGIIFHDALS